MRVLFIGLIVCFQLSQAKCVRYHVDSPQVSGKRASASANCPLELEAIAGGCEVLTANGSVYLSKNFPLLDSGTLSGWLCEGTSAKTGGLTRTNKTHVRAHIVCCP